MTPAAGRRQGGDIVADETRRDDRLEGEVLGINDGPVNKDASDMPFDRRRNDPQASSEHRRRRSDDLVERRRDPGAGPDGPDGIKVQI
jgi:hypothetical protein